MIPLPLHSNFSVSSILEQIEFPKDLKNLNPDELSLLAEELRQFVQSETKTKEGHIKSSLGVVELTMALHYTFNTPEDILIWDVGHQAYIHKILTGRKKEFHTNRMLNGLSGFTSRKESIYDPFGAGHSSTSISAACGFAEAAKLAGIKRDHIAVIGDGSITGGESFEALNYLGEKQLNVIVVLNNNESSIDENVGALTKTDSYQQYCQALNVKYEGKVDGHNIEELLLAFEKLRSENGPRFIQVNTKKGKGWETSDNVKPSSTPNTVSFQEVFADTLIELAQENDKIVAISPAMLSGSGLSKFKEHFPERTFDVGIAEQHAVTMAAALAADGCIPICHLYSTFAQRAYDQIIHDVALQNLPVIFALDRAGLVGEDGATHHGAFDIGFLNTIPNINIAAPTNGDDLKSLLVKAIESKEAWAIRYPKENTSLPTGYKSNSIERISSGKNKALLSFGAIGADVQQELKNSPYAHYKVLEIKPLNEEAIAHIFNEFSTVVVLEENSSTGGLGEKLASLKSKWNSEVRLKCISLPDSFIQHGKRTELLEQLGMDPVSVMNVLDGIS